MLAIAAHIPSGEIGSTYFQETHPENLFKECSHYCELVSSPRQMPRVLEIAIREAVGKQGVSVVVLPGDIEMSQKISERIPMMLASFNFTKDPAPAAGTGGAGPAPAAAAPAGF